MGGIIAQGELLSLTSTTDYSFMTESSFIFLLENVNFIDSNKKDLQNVLQ